MISAYAWTLTYDDGSTERVRAVSPARAVQKRTAIKLPALVSSRTLVRRMGTQRLAESPIRDRVYGAGWGDALPLVSVAPAVLRPEARVYPAQYRAIGYEPETSRQEGW